MTIISKDNDISYTSPIKAKTAQEFADKLYIHPNHLNALLKKHTEKNASTHITKSNKCSIFSKVVSTISVIDPL